MTSGNTTNGFYGTGAKPMVFSTNATERMTIDSSGNVGIGVVPSAWRSSTDAIQFGQSASISSNNNANAVSFTSNAYINSSNNSIRISTGKATNYYQYDGAHVWEYAGSGSAGSTVSYSEAMRIDSSGNVGIGTSSPSDPLHVSGSGHTKIKVESTGTNASIEIHADSGGDNKGHFRISGDPTTAGGLFIYDETASAERMRIDSSGNVGIGDGTISHTSMLHIYKSGATADLALQSAGASGRKHILQSKTDGSLAFYDNNASTERMRIDSSGNLLVGHTSITDWTTTAGAQVRGTGFVIGSVDGDYSFIANRLTSDGEIMQFRKDGAQVGSITTHGGSDIGIGSGDTGLRFQPSADAIFGYNNISDSGRNGQIDLGKSDNRFKDLYLSGGVYLGGTVAANKLDDYEEGTWTPTYSFDGGGTVTTTTNTGLYVKVGNLVHCAFRIRSTGVSGVSGNLYINGFPFTAVSDSRSAGSKWFARNWGSDMPNFSFGVVGGQTYASVYKNAMNTGTSAVGTSDFSTGSDNNVLEASITYRVA